MVSSTSSIAALASIFSIIATSSAHMMMKTPIPYGRNGALNNSPLNNDGSDFPCKNIFTMTDPVNDINHLVVGESNTLSFTGSAVHGGGSCQVMLAKGWTNINSKTQWSVIKSIEGGCPANVAGNLPADPNGNGASTFQYTIPDGWPAGDYTIAWTWYNKIGNRELYMNCGAARIVDSKKRYAPAQPKIEHRAADYPDMFKANLAIFGQCTVPEGINVAFPNPGKLLQTIGTVTPPTGCAAGSSPNPGTGGGSDTGTGSGSNTGSGTGAQSSAVTTTAGRAAPTGNSGRPASSANGGGNGGRPSGFATNGGGSANGARPTAGPGVFASGAASQSTVAATDSPVETGAPDATDAPTNVPSAQPTAQATATVQPVPAAPSPSSGSNGNGSSPPTSGSSGSSTQGSACSEEGAWMCASDGKSFQRCASGRWSASMQVAAGTSCTPGQSMNLSMKVVSSPGGIKRSLFSHEHGSPHHRRAFRLSS